MAVRKCSDNGYLKSIQVLSKKSAFMKREGFITLTG